MQRTKAFYTIFDANNEAIEKGILCDFSRGLCDKIRTNCIGLTEYVIKSIFLKRANKTSPHRCDEYRTKINLVTVSVSL